MGIHIIHGIHSTSSLYLKFLRLNIVKKHLNSIYFKYFFREKKMYMSHFVFVINYNNYLDLKKKPKKYLNYSNLKGIMT